MANDKSSFFQGAGNIITGGALGIATGAWQDARQEAQSQKLIDQQVEANRKIGTQNRLNALQMWKDTNFSAQVAEMEKAGINPALLYGQSGAGGATTSGATGGTASGGTAQGGSGEVGMGIQQAMNLELLKAQKANIEANTNKTNAEAENLGGVERDLKQQQIEESKKRIEEITAGITNKETINGLIKAQTKIAELDGLLKNSTIDEQANILKWTANKIEQEALQALNETYISNQTKELKIQMFRTELIGRYLANELTKAQTEGVLKGVEVDTQKIQSMKTEIVQQWESLRQGKQRVDVEQFAKEMQAKYPSMWNVVGKAMTDFFKGMGAKQYNTENN